VKQPNLTDFLHRLSQAILRSPTDRIARNAMKNEDQETSERRLRQDNHQFFARVAFNFALMLFLVTIMPSADRIKAYESLLIICSQVTCVFALIRRERWSLTTLNRWDDALIFTTLALGLRIFV
jgi:hypothetical protein